MDSGPKYLAQSQIVTCSTPFEVFSKPAKRRRGANVPAERRNKQTADNLRLSGGFPHSEIPGSKGALASPGLIAECHVLHRLLLPRHPPNALLALDPIQKKTGPFACGWFGRNPLPALDGSRLDPRARAIGDGPGSEDLGRLSVSVIDLERLFWLSYRFAA